jgi:hypothetical protein
MTDIMNVLTGSIEYFYKFQLKHDCCSITSYQSSFKFSGIRYLYSPDSTGVDVGNTVHISKLIGVYPSCLNTAQVR